ncbi:MAG: hypothetical protein ACD_7C00429G0007 [uncultured bacterium]|nr:MAG: hypothetical protein ACD_7C00429G0007 [uncultured bacterium]KKP68048.1 MAG: hypothetical protein UR66_C0009G0138 [Candidatus Moranbacteria bacterium GW2011_GWE1_35_17]KKP70482.1 MAG: hypothetical protein UR65_C0040G0005 [Candidatus Moranbacteria bacterium GW2011_GWE2_35_164]KKP81428.1 MAG: hypothetical protein UR82_C0064G0010 [Candidatus Moranbacteria bacterium GW2011_GWF1_35_5]KKP84962.1 MAG: hypothetical protein UR83_C0007G0008 [Candidatus Moranbacteria bacterium GW2011_GWF2_35_54]HB
MPEIKNKKSIAIIPDERIIGKIYYIRGEKVIFDRDLAVLYEVETKVLNQAVKRNIKRFPEDFMFKLSQEEMLNWKSQIVTSKNESLRSQIVTLKKGRGQHLKYIPYVFTEQGVAMLSSVLNSDRAIQVNIQIMRTFTRMRKLLSTHKELRDKMEKMEKKNGENFKVIFKIINKLIATNPNDKELKIIGFNDK